MITYEELRDLVSDEQVKHVLVDGELMELLKAYEDEFGKYIIVRHQADSPVKIYADESGKFNNISDVNYKPIFPPTDAFQAYLDAKRKEQEDADGTSKVRAFRDIVTGMADLYAKKNKDYGDSFGQSFKEYGAYASTQRLHDKLNRIKQLLKSGDTAVKTESVIDTLTDLACYAIMLRIEIEQQTK
jgi:hypothetical protein